MYQPNYKLTDRLINHLVKLESDRTIVSSQFTPSPVKLKMEKRTKVLNLFHLAHMLEVPLSLREAEKLAEGKKVFTQDKRGAILNNFRNILEFNRSTVATSYPDVDLNLINHLNKLLLTDWRESWEAKIRGTGENPDGEFDDYLGIRQQTVDSSLIHNELASLIDWYKSNQSLIYVLIRIAVLTERFLRIAPYSYGNKLTMIALADFLLYRAGYTGKAYLPLVRSFDVSGEDFLESLTMVAESGDMTIWIERFVRNLASDMADVREEYFSVMAEQEKSVKQPFLDLNKRQLKILRYLQTIPTVKREDYCQMMDVSTMTAFRDLSDLVRKKLLKIEGEGRGTKYMLYTR